jgi:hypothetical protein
MAHVIGILARLSAYRETQNTAVRWASLHCAKYNWQCLAVGAAGPFLADARVVSRCAGARVSRRQRSCHLVHDCSAMLPASLETPRRSSCKGVLAMFGVWKSHPRTVS